MNLYKLYKKIKMFFCIGSNSTTKKTQTLFIYCECGNDLAYSNSFISDTYDKNGDNHVFYKCSRCGKEHDYNFDVAPLPINWKQLKKAAREAK